METLPFVITDPTEWVYFTIDTTESELGLFSIVGKRRGEAEVDTLYGAIPHDMAMDLLAMLSEQFGLDGHTINITTSWPEVPREAALRFLGLKEEE